MSSEAITRNDLTNILNEVLPPTPSEYKKLLWSNPSASYSTGTISLDLSEYDEVEVVFASDDGLVVEFSASCPVGKSGHGEWWDIRSDLSNYAAINGVTRSFSTSSTGVTFQNGNMFYNGASYNGWATRAIPRRIYGIKYDRVYPPQIDAQIVHSVYDGTSTLQVSGGTYYSLFTLEAGIWIIFLTFFTYSGDVVICYGGSINNVITENGNSNAANGHSGAGVIELSAQTVIQMYVTDNTTLYRFKADAVKIA